MIICPFGTACRVRMNLDLYLKSGLETQLVDYTLCNFDTILYLIENIYRPFNASEFYDANQTSVTNHRTICHKSVFWHIPHEFPTDQSFQQFMPIFLDRFNRRKMRLESLIKTQDKCVHFVHFLCSNNGSPIEIPSLEKMAKLFELFKRIYPFSYLHVHLLVHPDFINKKDIIDLLCINNYVHIHYMKRIGPPPLHDNEHRIGSNWNWNEVFENIKNYDILMDEVIKIINQNKNK